MRRRLRDHDWLQQEREDWHVERAVWLEGQKRMMEELERRLDALHPRMRQLVYEFGANIVLAMVDEGYTSARDLRPVLEEYHRRRQEQLLSTDHHLKFANRRRGP